MLGLFRHLEDVVGPSILTVGPYVSSYFWFHFNILFGGYA
jgi:hypothetical protein